MTGVWPSSCRTCSKTRFRTAPAASPWPSRWRGGANVTFSVHNFGKVIPLHDRERIFEPRSRGSLLDEKRAPNGLGLGLYICREIMRAHMGTLSVRSTRGKAPHSLRAFRGGRRGCRPPQPKAGCPRSAVIVAPERRNAGEGGGHRRLRPCSDASGAPGDLPVDGRYVAQRLRRLRPESPAPRAPAWKVHVRRPDRAAAPRPPS